MTGGRECARVDRPPTSFGALRRSGDGGHGTSLDDLMHRLSTRLLERHGYGGTASQHRIASDRPAIVHAASVRPNVDSDRVDAFLRFLAVEGDRTDASVQSPDLRDGLIVAALERLGQDWCDDRTDFATVTLSAQKMTRLLADWHHRAPNGDGPSILLAAAPGETHLLALDIVADRLREAGWRVVVENGRSPRALAAKVAASEVDIVGFGLSTRRLAATLVEYATVLSRHIDPSVDIVVGGSAVAASDELLTCGAIDGVLVGDAVFALDEFVRNRMSQVAHSKRSAVASHHAALTVLSGAS